MLSCMSPRHKDKVIQDSVQQRVRRLSARLIGITLMVSGLAPAQINTGEIRGTIRDSAGGAITRASVSAADAATNLRFTSETNDAGEFLLAQLPPGEYTLTASAPGFKDTVQPQVMVHAGDRDRHDFVLSVGQKSSETVQIVESPMQTESAAVKDIIENQQVMAIPLKNRDFLELTMLSAGVVNPPGGTRGDSLQQTGKLINILGQRTGHNLFLVDGVSVTDEYYNNVVLSPPPDDIREFSIGKTNYDAEFGGKSGGVINVITQSGARSLSGKRI